tara:strand:- start:2682 stop:4139 length:1458 start_codon:yes stop_codon:yes gene_type:complete
MKLHGYIFLLASLLMLQSCLDDERNESSEEQEMEDSFSTLEVVDVITLLTADASKTWKIENAILLKDSGNHVDISSLYNLQDDEFMLSTNTTNTSVALRWKRGYTVTTSATTQVEARSDMKVSPLNATLSIAKTDTIFSLATSSQRLVGTYNSVNNTITGTIQYDDGASLIEVTLRPKTGADYETAATVASAPIELFSFQTGIPRVGFKISRASNSLFITNRDDLTGIGSQQAFKYNLETAALQEIEFVTPDFASKQIEFVDEKIASVGGNVFQSFDYDFTAPPVEYQLDNGAALINIGSAAQDDRLYVFGGLISRSSNANISSFSLTDTATNFLAALPTEKENSDGEIVDNKLYIFGGYKFSEYFDGTSEIYIYDLVTQEIETRTLPTPLIDTYTSTVGHLIYVGGRKPFDSDTDGVFDSYVPFLGVYNTLDDSFSQVNLNNPIPDTEVITHLQVDGDNAYLVTSQNLGSGQGYTNRVYSLDLE